MRSAPRKRAGPHVAHTVSNSDARARAPPKKKNGPGCARAHAHADCYAAGGHRPQTGASAPGATPRNQIPNCMHSGRTQTLSQRTLFLTRAAAKIAPIRARAGARARRSRPLAHAPTSSGISIRIRADPRRGERHRPEQFTRTLTGKHKHTVVGWTQTDNILSIRAFVREQARERASCHANDQLANQPTVSSSQKQ